ncbi:MAG: DinB family protein [Pseudomonadota bacterium]
MLKLSTHLQLMAQYNQWMNDKFIAALERQSDEILSKDSGAFFGSILGTLNHIITADLAWLWRMKTALEPAELAGLGEFPIPSLNEPNMFANFADYTLARQKLDRIIISFIDNLDEEILAAPFNYARANGEKYRKILGLVLCHFFNHQTHHRGQATTLLSQIGIDIGPTDLNILVPEA